jgi:TonB family protein
MGFEEAAVDAVKQWRYHPATRGGQAEDAVITVRIDFK